MILYLIRHGQSTNNAGHPRMIDPLLTALGEEQARHVAHALRDEGLTALHVSPMRRALATASAIREVAELPLLVAPEFCEEGGLGEHPGLTRAEILAHYPPCEIAETVTERGWWPGAKESAAEAYLRAQRAAEGLRRQYRGDFSARVAVVTHGNFASLLLNAFLEMPFERGVRFYQYNAAVSRLEFTPEFLNLIYVNRVDHLPAEKVTY
jgi:probable phosphoglycerate mutase